MRSLCLWLPFGSQIAPSWDLVLTDKFDTQSGHVVIPSGLSEVTEAEGD